MGGLCSDERKQNRTYQVECSLRRNQHEGDSWMQRRDFIKSVAAAGIIGTGGRRAHTAEMGWRQFEITYRINIKDSASDTDVRLWVPVPQDALDYQRVLDLRRFGAKPRKNFVDDQAASPSSWKTPRMAVWMAA
jgi:hypothetical protein